MVQEPEMDQTAQASTLCLLACSRARHYLLPSSDLDANPYVLLFFQQPILGNKTGLGPKHND
jgi:hypothetical protein